MIAIVDYGVGNLFSLSSSVKSLGAEVCVTRDADDLRAADHILLPGVGAFADAMAKLEATGLVPVLREETQKKPLLGICLGMQLLFEKSYEYGEHAGLGLIPGAVCPLADDLADPNLKYRTSAGTRWTSYPVGKTTRFLSTSKTASTFTTYTATTPKTALHQRLPPASTASQSPARCGRGWCTAPSSTRKNPATPACGC